MDGRDGGGGGGGGGSLTVRLKRHARCPDIPLDESSLSSRLTPGVHTGRSAHYAHTRCARILARENVDGARVHDDAESMEERASSSAAREFSRRCF